jgi:phytoene synthase
MAKIAQSDGRAVLSAYGRDIIGKGSKSFALASLLFGREMQADAQMLYAWCRWCDDVIDGQTLGGDAPDAAMSKSERALLLADLRDKTRRSLAGETLDVPAFDAFAEVARRHAMPEIYPFDLLDGFAMDAEDVRFDTLDVTMRYCYGVAGVVGVMMAILMGVPRDDDETLDRACDLGLAFQLTNICRDVLDDARGGRVYLPADYLACEGIDASPHAVLDSKNADGVWRTAVAMLDVADRYYESATFGIRRLPPRAGAAIAAARNIYRAIGEKIRAGGPSVWEQRVAVSGARKTLLAAQGLATGMPASLFLKSVSAPVREGLWRRSLVRQVPANIRRA